ncbi:sortase [Microbacterium atlanticum]|uniref:sortase n=1 Tax=Microbacterium atlanticum TaxID=2782168 RepID=UPI0018894ED9|nr:sortase [Microbacterium atlanticum]
MIKKSFAALAIAGALVFGGAAGAAVADPYPPEGGVTASDTTPAPGQSVVLRVTGIEGETSATFSITSGPAGASLASIVFASAGTSVTKPVVNGTAEASFTASASGTYVIAVTGGSGANLGSITLTVGSAAGAGGSGTLPATGGAVPAAAIWVGVGALGLGGIAVAAGVARKRAASSR